MKRTIAAFIAVVTLIFSSNVTLAADLQPYASLTLSRHFAEALSGDSRGKIKINFNVQARPCLKNKSCTKEADMRN